METREWLIYNDADRGFRIVGTLGGKPRVWISPFYPIEEPLPTGKPTAGPMSRTEMLAEYSKYLKETLRPDEEPLATFVREFRESVRKYYEGYGYLVALDTDGHDDYFVYHDPETGKTSERAVFEVPRPVVPGVPDWVRGTPIPGPLPGSARVIDADCA